VSNLRRYQTKNLSVNYVNRQFDLAQSDDGRCDVVERDKAALKFLVSHQQLSESVEPAMADLYHPAPRLLGWVTPLGIGFCATTHDVGNIAMRLDNIQGLLTSISRICAQVFAAPLAWALALDHTGAEHLIQLRDIMLIGSGHDERQRDTTAVHQQVPLAAFFFPDQSGWGQPPLAPVAL